MSTTTTIERSTTDSLLTDHLVSLAEEGERFASTAEAGDWDAPIAACPGWDLRELVKHVGLVHLWAAANIRFPRTTWLSVEQMSDLADYWPEHTTGWPSDDGLAGWYRSTLQNLLDVFESSPPDHQCLTFLPAPSPLIMWARRQTSEVAVHRHDAEAATGRTSRYDARFAIDMINELLDGFAPRMRPADVEHDTVLHVAANDGTEFFVTIGPSGVRTARTGDSADLRVCGTPGDLYLLMWNREPGPSVGIVGDHSVFDRWRNTCQINWI